MAIIPRFTSRVLPPGAQPDGSRQIVSQAVAKFALNLQNTISIARQRQDAIDEGDTIIVIQLQLMP